MTDLHLAETVVTDLTDEESLRRKLVTGPRGWETLSLILSANTTLQGHRFRGGTEVYYSRKKKLISAILSEATLLQGSLFPTGSIVYFYHDGCLEWASLPDATVIVSQDSVLPPVPALRSIFYYRNGNIKEVVVAEECTLQGVSFPAGSTVHLSNDGHLVWAQLSRDIYLTSRNLQLMAAAGSCVHFFRNGMVGSFALARQTILQGHALPKNSLLHFDVQGRLIRAETYEAPGRGAIIHFDVTGKVSLVSTPHRGQVLTWLTFNGR